MTVFNWNNRDLLSANGIEQAAVELFGPLGNAELVDNSGKLWLFLGQSLVARGYLSQSLLCFQSALACEPGLAGVNAVRGLVLFRLDRSEEAMAAYMAELALNPGDADVWVNLGVLYQINGLVEEALSCFESALLQRPGYVTAWANRAKAQRALGDFVGAKVSFNAAVMLSPHDQMLRLDRAICLMMLGDFEPGWRDYEARLALNAEPRILTDRWPVWQGEPLSGRSVLVLGEQGIGDIFQFARYVGDLTALGADVTLRVSERMIPLLTGLVASCRLITGPMPDAVFDFEIPLMSVPFRLSHTEVMRPVSARYLAAAPERTDDWARRFDDGSKALRVGITWQGSPDFIDDASRSVPLSKFAAIGRVPGVRLINLQIGAGTEQLAAVDFPIEQLGHDVDRDGAFVDTAAILENIDLLITSDTAIAHLAGALGLRVWVALARVPDWRWGMSGETTPWYPTMRLFRQKTNGDWDTVFETISAALAAEIGG